jgi:hypothetical protein
MTRFVDECRKEWSRLGVPTAEANEMASDLEADLAEAQADGASPEDVLGNGFFDPRSFAASWAMARGFARPSGRGRHSITIRTRSLVLGLCALVSAGLTVAGLLLVAQPGFRTEAMAVGFPQRFIRHLPQITVLPPRRIYLGGAGLPIDPLGWALLGVGLVSLIVTLLIWHPWSNHGGSGIDSNVGMPSLL